MVIVWDIVSLCPRVRFFGKSRIVITTLYGVCEYPIHSVKAVKFDDFLCTIFVQTIRCIGILNRKLNSSRAGTVFLITVEP